MLVRAAVSADMCVVMPREGSVVHHAVVAWVHVAGEGLGVARSLDPAIVGTRLPVLHLTPPTGCVSYYRLGAVVDQHAGIA